MIIKCGNGYHKPDVKHIPNRPPAKRGPAVKPIPAPKTNRKGVVIK